MPCPFLFHPLTAKLLAGIVWQLGFSDPKPGLALRLARKHMPLRECLFSSGLGTSLPGELEWAGGVGDSPKNAKVWQQTDDTLWLSTEHLPINHTEEHSPGSYKPDR